MHLANVGTINRLQYALCPFSFRLFLTSFFCLQLFYRFAAWSFTQSSSLKLWAWKFTMSSTGVTAWHGVQLYSRLGVPSFIAWTLRTTKTTIRTNSLKLEKKRYNKDYVCIFFNSLFSKTLVEHQAVCSVDLISFAFWLSTSLPAFTSILGTCTN